MGQKSFAQFCQRFQWGSICVGEVVRAIRADINNEDRPLVICVDEVMLWGGEGDDKGERTSNLVKAIAELPASHRQVYTVLSGLEPEAVRRGVSWTNRTPVPALLQGVDEQYPHQLISRMLPKPREPPSFLALLIRDCNGCPRLLEHLSVILCQQQSANSQLESLTVVASKLSNHTTYKTKLRLKTPSVQTHLFQALVLAVRATTVAEETLGDLSQHGLISQSFDETDQVRVAPLFAMIVHRRWCQVHNEETRGMAKVISQLLDWFSKYLTYDQNLPNPFIAVNPEVQFALAWAMRCRALVSSTATGQYDESVLKKVVLTELLNSTVSTHILSASIVVPATPATQESDVLPYRKMDVKEFDGASTEPIPTGVMILPKNPNNEGYDLMAVYDTPAEGEQFAIVIQVKYSAKNTSTSLSNRDIVTAVRNTVKHHPYLHRFIKCGQFLFVFAAHRLANDNVSIDGCRKEVSKKGKGKGKGKGGWCEATDNLVNTVVDKHLHLMLQHGIEQFLGPTLYARPQFWSHERTAHPSKKRKTK